MSRFPSLLQILLSFCLITLTFGAQSADTPQSDFAPRVVKPNSATRPLDPKLEQRASEFQSDKQSSLAIETELAKPKPFSNGIPLAIKELGIKPMAEPVASVPTWDVKDAWSAWCESNWDQSCEGFETWNPPNNWDICRFNVVEESKSHGEWGVVAADPKKITVRLKSWGSHAFFDRWGGWVRVKLQTAQLIPSSATQEQRKTLGCAYNNGGGSAGQGLSEFLFCAADPTDSNGSFGIQMCADYIYENGIKKFVRGPYPCGVCFRR